MTKKLDKEEIDNRDRSSSAYHYFKPVAGEVYKSQCAKRMHYCEKCKATSEIAPYYFWKGSACQKCSSKRGKQQELDKNILAERDNTALCFDTYPPDPNQPYKNQYTKRNHTCSDCGYKGQIIPKSFWMGRGCPVCGAKKGSYNKIKNASLLVEEKDKRSTTYEKYPPVSQYKGVNIGREHKCVDCGYVGKMKPDNFWHNNRGCPKCGAKKANLSKRLNNKKRAPSRDKLSPHYETYPPISEYTGAFEHRDHQCSECGYRGKMIPNNFWRGRGCPICAESGFNKDVPAILYYLKVRLTREEYLYKIGVTNRTVFERYSNTDLVKIETLKIWEYSTGKEAFSEERKIKNKYLANLYKGENVLQSGNTELFVTDVLGLDR